MIFVTCITAVWNEGSIAQAWNIVGRKISKFVHQIYIQKIVNRASVILYREVKFFWSGGSISQR